MKIHAFFISFILTLTASSQVLIDPCIDFKNVDFGFCEMTMWIGVVGGECVCISGCGWVIDGIDFSQMFYSNFESCELCLNGEGEGYTWSVELNYSPNANVDKGTCVFPDCMLDCKRDIEDDIVSVEDVI